MARPDEREQVKQEAKAAMARSMASTVGVLMQTKKLTGRLKSKAAATRARNSFRAIFVQYAEAFGAKEAEEAIIRAAFERVDADNSGYIDAQELRQMTEELGIPMDESDLQEALAVMDENGDNEIEFSEFRDWWVLLGRTGAGSGFDDDLVGGDGGPSQQQQQQEEGGRGRGGGGGFARAMVAFKAKLSESVARGTLDFVYLGFAHFCRDCNLLGRQELQDGVRTMVPSGSLPESAVMSCYHRAVCPEWKEEDEPEPEPEPEPALRPPSRPLSSSQPPSRPSTRDTVLTRPTGQLWGGKKKKKKKKRGQSDDSLAPNWEPEDWMLRPRMDFEAFFTAAQVNGCPS
jgi:hypothetical protein